MTDAEFWELIGLIDTTALDEGREDDAVLPVELALNGRPEAVHFAFEEVLSQKLYDIDGEEYADNAGESGGSDDAFLYARCYVVAKGQAFYQTVKADPARMPKTVEEWCESLLYANVNAWVSTTGKDRDDWPFTASVSYESGSNPALWRN